MIKLLNDTQGAILLVEHGLASQARVALRAALETLFVLGNVCFDEHFSRSFIAASEQKRLTHLRAIQNNGCVPLLHTGWPRHVRALLYKRGNIEGEVLHRLIYLDIVLPSCGRPDPVVVFL